MKKPLKTAVTEQCHFSVKKIIVECLEVFFKLQYDHVVQLITSDLAEGAFSQTKLDLCTSLTKNLNMNKQKQ